MAQQIIVNNLLINYTKVGEAGEQTLLFLHGWRSQAAVWRPVVESLSSYKAYQVIAMDLPGFGGSSAPTTPSRFASHPSLKKEGNTAGWGVGDYAEVVAGFIKKLDLKNVTLVGHSFGGRVGIKLAAMQARTLADETASADFRRQNNSPRPPLYKRGGEEMISKLVLVDSAGFAMPTSRKKIMAAAAKIVKPFFKPKFMQGLRKKIYGAIGAEDYVATPELQSTFVNITSEDLTEDMKKIVCPTLIITGENDKDTPVEFGQRMASLIPNTRYLILKGAGHFSFLDQPEEFVNVVSRFIGSMNSP